uniref:Uncharacterized protein n=1 Tax=Oryza sativa subsp. japonica TaxID=39947 RepID=Q6Z9A0_ORYSJ|nr:hypothetical protein [Oryza sativa Japonica Group]
MPRGKGRRKALTTRLRWRGRVVVAGGGGRWREADAAWVAVVPRPQLPLCPTAKLTGEEEEEALSAITGPGANS